jgi:fatty acid desaturase
LHKFLRMEQQKKNTGFYWLLTFVSAAALVWAIAAHFEYLTLILPFLCTGFVKAMDIM